jgi:hypothetical protein
MVECWDFLLAGVKEPDSADMMAVAKAGPMVDNLALLKAAR